MKQFEFDVECTVTKTVLVEAENEEEASQKLDKWDVVEERENGMSDWKTLSGPELCE
jgi:hypothetical protein